MDIQPQKDLLPAAVGQVQVQDDYLRLQALDARKRRGHRGGLADDLSARQLFQPGAQELAHRLGVIDEKDRACLCHEFVPAYPYSPHCARHKLICFWASFLQ